MKIVIRMSHQVIYLAAAPMTHSDCWTSPRRRRKLPAAGAPIAPQPGRVHAALGNERDAERHLGQADELVGDGLGDDVRERVGVLDAAEHVGARRSPPAISPLIATPGQRADRTSAVMILSASAMRSWWVRWETTQTRRV
ncbi:hypothetical protein JCM4814A_82270 [Streptomyces phaeofaciens JCM 4814]|uniref:Uncharacterized protein n=1 Tax=Streptomyces phaeofaciens TaxID=68254 RepID=A0A918HP01_9ACTN|nr:hypothetical protein GCM10010226_80260 [Streptomyces phaeofaciens]